MISVSVFINSKGITASPTEEGFVKIYKYDTDTKVWEVSEIFEFSLLSCSSIPEMRKTILDLLQKLGNCRIFIARSVVGQLYSVLDANRFHIYEVDGKPEEFLDSILRYEEDEAQALDTEITEPQIPCPQETDIPGTYTINLKNALNSAPGLSSKKILLPFLTSSNFNILEIICDHIPKWFDSEFNYKGLSSTITKLNEFEYKVTISTSNL
jgi:Fe-only nitrogenase accessory protein AnfO